MLETVQRDLGLTADQIGKLRDIAKAAEAWRPRDFIAEAREILPPSQPFSPKESEERRRKLRAWYDDLRSKQKELWTKALATLTPNQNARLRQIQLQVAIPDALARPEIIKALDVSEEQRAKIQSLLNQLHERRLAERPVLRGLNPKERGQKTVEFMRKWDEAGAAATKGVLDVLTPEQRTKLERLQGNKIDANACP